MDRFKFVIEIYFVALEANEIAEVKWVVLFVFSTKTKKYVNRKIYYFKNRCKMLMEFKIITFLKYFCFVIVEYSIR